MKRADSYPHNPVLGKAGDFVDVLSRVPADTEIVIVSENRLSRRYFPDAIDISLGSYCPIEHEIELLDDGSIKNTLNIRINFKWNRDDNLGEAAVFASLFSALEHLFFVHKYDARKLPNPRVVAKTAANNPSAFLDMLNEFQKKYKNKHEKSSL